MALNVLKYFQLLYILMQISQVHLLHASRQVHFHGNTRIWQKENMQKMAVLLCIVQKSLLHVL